MVLSETLKDNLAPLDLPVELEVYINLASNVDKRLFERQTLRVHQDQFQWAPASQQRVVPPAPTKILTDRGEPSTDLMELGSLTVLGLFCWSCSRQLRRGGELCLLGAAWTLDHLLPDYATYVQSSLVVIGESNQIDWHIQETTF